MTFNKFSLTNIRTIPYPILVSLLNGYKFKVTEYGDAHITSKIVLNKALHVSSFKYNLFSFQSLVSLMKCIVFITNTTCLLQATSVKKPLAIGSSKDDIYYVYVRCLKDTVDAKNLVCCCLSHGCMLLLFQFQFLMNNVLENVLNTLENFLMSQFVLLLSIIQMC